MTQAKKTQETYQDIIGRLKGERMKSLKHTKKSKGEIRAGHMKSCNDIKKSQGWRYVGAHEKLEKHQEITGGR